MDQSFLFFPKNSYLLELEVHTFVVGKAKHHYIEQQEHEKNCTVELHNILGNV